MRDSDEINIAYIIVIGKSIILASGDFLGDILGTGALCSVEQTAFSLVKFPLLL
jgi:hypothetical protein